MGIKQKQQRVRVPLIAAFASLIVGCASLDDPNVPEPIRRNREPRYQTDYLVYRPSAYERSSAWPLVVVCHGRFPDSARRQIRDWTQLAERFGFIVAAPRLGAARGGARSKPDEQRHRLERDRDRILAVVRHVRAAQTVSSDRVFVHGRGGGGRLALFTGLTEPDTFRAIGVSNLKFDASWFSSPEVRIDPYQPILLQHTRSGVSLSKDAHRCIEWLRTRHADVQVDATTSHPDVDAERAVEFYESVIRSKPWLRIQVARSEQDDPLMLRFKLRGTYKPKKYLWDFGDGDTAAVAEPIHRFSAPGVYRTTVTLDGPRGESVTRFKDVWVPRALVDSLGARP